MTHETAQRRLPEPLRSKAVQHLRDTMHPEWLEWLREFHARDPEWGDELTPEEHRATRQKYGYSVPSPFHFGAGMAIRNMLRQVVKDEELPIVHYGAHEDRNWDDWYQGVIEEAIGVG